MINRKLGGGQPNRAGYRKANSITVIRVGECLTQRARPAVVGIGDIDVSGRSWSRCGRCRCRWRWAGCHNGVGSGNVLRRESPAEVLGEKVGRTLHARYVETGI